MTAFKTSGVFLAFFVLFVFVTSGTSTAGDESLAPAQSSYALRSYVIGAGGGPAAGTGNNFNGTLGQPTPIGQGSNNLTTIDAGYWAQVRPWIPTGTTTPVVLRNELFQNYPNPFNPTTTVEYTLAQALFVEIEIFNVRGQKVKTLVNETRPPGRHRVQWNGNNDAGLRVASGVYFYRIRAGSYTDVKKLVLLK
jgi:hypothetical protein